MRSSTRLGVLATLLLATTASAQTRLFCTDSTNLKELDPTTGAVLATIPMIGGGASTGGLAYDASTDTLFLGSTSLDNLYTLDYTTGVLTLVGPFNVGTAVVMHGMEIDDQGQLYGYSSSVSSGARFFSIDRNTGQATPISDPATGGFGSMAFVPSANTMYFCDTSLDQFGSIDRSTGALTVIGPLGVAAQVGIGMAYHPNFGIYAVNNSGTDSMWSIDPATGTATLVANLATSNILSLAFVEVSPVHVASCFGDGTGTACPCGNAGAAGNGCASSVNAAGANLAASGNASIAADTLVLSGTGMPNNSALYFQGTTLLNGGAGVVFGDGLRCVGGSIVRLGTKTNVAGASAYPGGSALISIKGNNIPGGTRHYQTWYRNPASFCAPETYNLTNAVTVLWTP